MEESDVLESDGDVSNDAVLLEDAVMYVQEKIYRSGTSKNWKRSVRRKAQRFSIENGELMYKKKNNSLVCYVPCMRIDTKSMIACVILADLSHGPIQVDMVRYRINDCNNMQVRYITSTEEKQRILVAYHSDSTSGHMGSKKTLSRITERVLYNDVCKLVSLTN